MAFLTCNHKRMLAGRFIVTIMLCAASGAAFSQALPWQTQPPQPPQYPPQYAAPQYPPQYAPPPQYPAQSPPQHSHHKHANQGQPVGGPNATRDEDDRQLNLLATKFYGITAKDPDVIPKLRALEGEVRSYRDGLSSRSYDATDISSDAGKLEYRIARQRKGLEAKAAAAAAPQQPAPVVPVQSVPPAGAMAPAAPSLSPVAPLSSPGAGGAVSVR